MARWRRRRCAFGGHPELRMAYGARALSLGHGILDLLPPPPESAAPCSACSGAGCLLCRRWAHLIRDDDPIAYRHLVTRAVCVLDPAAPPPPRYTLGNSGLSQAKLVGLTMKMMLEQGKTTNVLCNGRGAEVGQAQDLVSSSSWDILLHRTGDLPMCYILRHSSIFLPVKKRTYLQVTGLPIISLLKQRTIQQSQSTDEFQGPMETAKKKCPTCYLWRDAAMAHNNLSRGITSKSADNTEEVLLNPPATSSDTPSIVPKKPRKRKRLYRWQRCSKQKQACRENMSTDDQVNTCFPQIQDPCNVPAVLLSSHNSPSSACVLDNIKPSPTPQSGRCTESADNTQNNTEEALLNPPATSSDAIEPNCEFTHKPRKRKRMYSWQCCSKQKQLCRENTSTDAQVNTCFPQIQEPSNVPAVLLSSPTPQSGPICFNCLMLNASKRVSVDSLIRRFGTFYNTRISRNVFRNSLSNKRKGTDAALSLIKRVFGIKDCCIKFFQCECGGSSTTNSNCLYHWLLQQVKNLIRNSKRCQYQKLFMRHCSAKSKVAEDGFPSAQLEAYSTHQQVVSFVWAVLARIIPEPLLGNPSSKRCLRLNIWKFVSLRRFETFQVTDCIGELKVSYYSWLSKFGSTGCSCSVPVRKVTEVLSGMEEQKQNNLLRCWISWLFSGIVIPLISTYFYVTERETKRYDVFYYPKSVWRKLTSNAIASLDKQSFRTLCGASRIAIRHLYRPSTVRFVPKEKDVRPVVKFKTQRKDGLLSKCHLVIKKVRDENPEMFGSSVFDYDSIHKKLSSFMSSVRGQLKEELKIYIVVADVSKAFDCINQDMLLKIMDDVLKGDEYVLRNCTKVVYNSSKNAVYRFDSNVSVSIGNDFSIQPLSGGGILVDQGTVSTIRKEELHRVLFEQVKCNILKLGQNFYLQQVGIAQGNKLSTHLCSLYYGNLENSVILKFLDDAKISSGDAGSVQEHLLMRFTNDFIFVSFSKEHALNFWNRMRRGFVYYNSYMNERKYGFNFKVGSSEDCHNRLNRGDGVCFMPWSGLLINCETLEIQADYTRYSDITIKSTLTVKMHSSIKEVGSKLCHYMRPKCHPIFYDSNINSPGTVRLNLYQAFLLCAMKFHCYIGRLGDPSSIISKPEELLHMIKGTFKYMHGLIEKRMAGVPLVLKLKRKETIWLGLSAYIRVLGKKQSRHKDLLALLMEEVGPMDRASADSLRYAVDDSHSSVFWKFKY